MEAGALPTAPLLALSKTLKPSPSPNPYRLLLHRRRPCPLPLSAAAPRLSSSGTCFGKGVANWGSREWFLISFAGSVLRSSPHAGPPGPGRLASISSSAAFSGSGGGGDGIGGPGGGRGGDGGSSGGEADTKSVAGGTEDLAALGSDVIVLDVGGMSCGGCAASVKRILESQPQVTSATVNLATETAVVWVISEAKNAQNWRSLLGEKLASHLTTCGFKSSLRGQGNDFGGQ